MKGQRRTITLRFAAGARVTITRAEAALLTRMIRAGAGVERVAPLASVVDSLLRKGAVRRAAIVKGVEIYVATEAGRLFAAAYAGRRATQTMKAARRAAAFAAQREAAGAAFVLPGFTDEKPSGEPHANL